MKIKADTPEEYIAQLPEKRKKAIEKIRQILLDNIPEGFIETMSYGMIGYVIPHSLYPKGYHVNPKLPLPFINLASQKNYIALYHNGVYADRKINKWFVAEYARRCKNRLDMGKSCIRFKNTEDIPYELIAELARKIEVHDWIKIYETNTKK